MTGIYSCIFLGITKSVEQNFLYFMFLAGSELLPFLCREKRRRKGRAEFLAKWTKYMQEHGVLNLCWP